MPRPEEGDWGDFALLPRNVALLTTDSPLKCVCPDYPCTETTCLRSKFSEADRCPACARHGQALYTRAEIRWADGVPNHGLPEAEIRALQRLWVGRAGYNGVGARAALPADIGDEQPEPVAEAC